MKLKELQSNFMDALLQQRVSNSISALSETLTENGQLSALQRIQIYQNAYRSRLFSTIDSDYPALGSLLGDDLYNPLVNTYIDQHPSESPSLNNFGAKLPAFIRTFEPICHQEIVIELCDFEWQLRETFNAKNAKALLPEYLQSIEDTRWPTLTFQLSPGFALKYFNVNTCDVWKALKEGDAPDIHATEHPTAWIIWRRDLITQFQSIETDEACLLELVAKGHSFEQLCEALLEWWPEEQVPQRAFQLLQHWLSLGLLT